MKTRFILTAAAIFIVTVFATIGCDNSSTNSSSSDMVGGEQFEKGVALFGHDVETGLHFTQHLYPYLGATLAAGFYGGHNYESMTPIWVDGKQYVMGMSSQKSDEGYFWFIQLIFPSGDFGPITDWGYFAHHYKTLIALTRPDSGRVFVFGQRDYDDNVAFTREVLPGGIWKDEDAWSDSWGLYYDTVTPLPNNYYTCFFMHDSHGDNQWFIECINTEGCPWDHDKGDFDHGWQNAVAYRVDGYSYLFGHRHDYHVWDGHYYGPWFIFGVTNDSYLGSNETDWGTWYNYYKTMTIFEDPVTQTQYLFGHNTDKHWFIQHVDHLGHMDETIQHGGPWGHYYEHLFPIDFDTAYLDVNNWMERMLDEIDGFGDRKLSQIALPASHDSGMSEGNVHGCSSGGRTCNTQTQIGDIGDQLSLGARYFDIRPMIDTNQYGGSDEVTTGHAGKVGTDITAGCRGESKPSIMQALQDFFANGAHSKELVILKVSHCMTPPGNGYADCTSEQKSEFAYAVANELDQRGVRLVKGDIDLSNTSLKDLLAIGNVILVVQDVRARDKGIYQWGYGGGGDYYTYDDYSNTEEFGVMLNGGKNNSGDTVPGQIAKLLDSKNHEYPYDVFLLSWTLTLTGGDAFDCPLGSPSSILEMAAKAQPRIYEYMYLLVEAGKITKTLFPNLLYVDTFNRTTTNAAIYLNRKYDSLNE